MHVSRAQRSPRAFRVAATVVALPLCLTACATGTASGVRAAELRAASGSDLMSIPTEQSYEVSEFTILDSDEEAVGEFSPSGYMVLSDGSITEARFVFTLPHLPEASFELAQPVALRTSEPVTANGTLSVLGLAKADVAVRLLTTKLDAESAEFDVDFELPPEAQGLSGVPADLSAHAVLTAQDR